MSWRILLQRTSLILGLMSLVLLYRVGYTFSICWTMQKLDMLWKLWWTSFWLCWYLPGSGSEHVSPRSSTNIHIWYIASSRNASYYWDIAPCIDVQHKTMDAGG